MIHQSKSTNTPVFGVHTRINPMRTAKVGTVPAAGSAKLPIGRVRSGCGGSGGNMGTAGYSAASIRASARAGWTSRLSAMSLTRSPALTATAMTEMSSAA